MRHLTALFRPALLAAALLPLAACDDSTTADAGAALSAPTLDALALLPPDAETVAMIDIREAERAGALGDALAQMERTGGETQARLDEFEQQTGFVPERDLERVYFALTGESPVFVVRAQMDRDRLVAFLDEQPEMTRAAYRGLPLFTAAEADGERFAVALLNNDLALAGAESDVRAAADRALDGGPSAATDAAFTQLLGRARHGEAWIVSRHMAGQNAPFDVASGVLSMDFDPDGIQVAAVAEPTSGASSDDLAEAIEGAIAVARLQSEDDRDARAMLDGVRVQTRGDLVEVRGALSSQQVQRIHAD